MSFPSYLRYRDSHVEWLREVPEHWKVKRLKNIASINMGQSPSSDDCTQDEVGLPFLQGNADFGEISPFPRSYCSVANKLAKVNDILFSVRAPVGAINIADQPYGIGRGLCAITPNSDYSMRYVFHALQVMKSELFAVATGSTYEAVSTAQVGNASCLVPDLTEQIQIATFLDNEVAKIDELVAEQRRLMGLLKEKRQAVISYAVTNGLNPNAPMKSSGIEWLGDIPAHWKVTRMKYLGEAITGLTYSPDDIAEENSGTLVLRSSNVQNGEITFDDNVYVSSEISEKLTTRIGDILICSRNGSRALIGKNATIDEHSEGLSFGAFMTIFRSPLSDYVSCILNSPLFEYQSGAFMTSTINQLTIGVLNNMEVPLPPESERKQIAAFIAAESAKFNNLTAEALRAIDLLQERRTAIISAAVTGKIDVRNVYKEAA